MQGMCGFETMVRGQSPWCNVFNSDEWKDFEYARDVNHYYTAGPGNKYAGVMGWPWMNATAELMRKGPEQGRVFFDL